MAGFTGVGWGSDVLRAMGIDDTRVVGWTIRCRVDEPVTIEIERVAVEVRNLSQDEGDRLVRAGKVK